VSLYDEFLSSYKPQSLIEEEEEESDIHPVVDTIIDAFSRGEAATATGLKKYLVDDEGLGSALKAFGSEIFSSSTKFSKKYYAGDLLKDLGVEEGAHLSDVGFDKIPMVGKYFRKGSMLDIDERDVKSFIAGTFMNPINYLGFGGAGKLIPGVGRVSTVGDDLLKGMAKTIPEFEAKTILRDLIDEGSSAIARHEEALTKTGLKDAVSNITDFSVLKDKGKVSLALPFFEEKFRTDITPAVTKALELGQVNKVMDAVAGTKFGKSASGVTRNLMDSFKKSFVVNGLDKDALAMETKVGRDLTERAVRLDELYKAIPDAKLPETMERLSSNFMLRDMVDSIFSTKKEFQKISDPAYQNNLFAEIGKRQSQLQQIEKQLGTDSDAFKSASAVIKKELKEFQDKLPDGEFYQNLENSASNATQTMKDLYASKGSSAFKALRGIMKDAHPSEKRFYDYAKTLMDEVADTAGINKEKLRSNYWPQIFKFDDNKKNIDNLLTTKFYERKSFSGIGANGIKSMEAPKGGFVKVDLGDGKSGKLIVDPVQAAFSRVHKVMGSSWKKEGLADIVMRRGQTLEDIAKKQFGGDIKLAEKYIEEKGMVNILDSKNKFNRDLLHEKVKSSGSLFMDRHDAYSLKKIMDDKEDSLIRNVASKIRAVYSSAVTLPNPAYYFRNHFSDQAKIAEHLGAEALSPNSQRLAAKLAYSAYDIRARVSEDLFPEKGIKFVDRLKGNLYSTNQLKKEVIQSADGKTYNLHDVYKAMEYRGLLDVNQFASEFMSKMASVMDDTSLLRETRQSPLGLLNIFSHNGIMAQQGRRNNNMNRALAVISSLKKGHTMDEAVDIAEQTIFNYGQLTHFEKNYLRNGLFFYTYDRKNAESTVRNFFRNPRRVGQNISMTRSAREETGENDLPDSMRNQLVIPIGKDENGKDEYLPLNALGVPFDNFIGNVGKFGSNGFKELIQRAHPALKYIAERSTGKDFYRGQDIEDLKYADEFKNLPQPIKRLFGLKTEIMKNPQTGEQVERLKGNPWTIHFMRSLPTNRTSTSILKSLDSDVMQVMSEVGQKDLDEEDYAQFFRGIIGLSELTEKPELYKYIKLEKYMNNYFAKNPYIRKFNKYYIPKNSSAPDKDRKILALYDRMKKNDFRDVNGVDDLINLLDEQE